MSRNEINASLQACKLFLENYEITEKRNPNKCKRFFEIIKHIRMFFQVTTAILERIEAIENQMEEITEKVK